MLEPTAFEPEVLICWHAQYLGVSLVGRGGHSNFQNQSVSYDWNLSYSDVDDTVGDGVGCGGTHPQY